MYIEGSQGLRESKKISIFRFVFAHLLVYREAGTVTTCSIPRMTLCSIRGLLGYIEAPWEGELFLGYDRLKLSGMRYPLGLYDYHIIKIYQNKASRWNTYSRLKFSTPWLFHIVRLHFLEWDIPWGCRIIILLKYTKPKYRTKKADVIYTLDLHLVLNSYSKLSICLSMCPLHQV